MLIIQQSMKNTSVRQDFSAPVCPRRGFLSIPFQNEHLPVLWFSEQYAAGFAAHTLFGLLGMVRRFGLRKKKGQG